MAYRTVFETKFRDGAAATDYASAACWSYVGQSGLFRRFHLYTGCAISHTFDQRLECTDMRLRLHNDGAVVLQYAKSSGVVSTSGLPSNVWDSLDVYQHVHRVVSRVNEEVSATGYFVQCWGNKDYKVKLRNHDETVATFRDPTQAHRWIVSQAS